MSCPNIHFRWGVQLFWAAFDPILAVVQLTVTLGYEKNDFWAFQKNNHTSECQVYVYDYFLKCPTIKFSQS